jgi:hypothetical protein
MKNLKTYDQFYEEISIGRAIGAGLIGAATLGSPTTAHAVNPPTKIESPAPGDTITPDKQKLLTNIVEEIHSDRPELFLEDSELPTEETMLTREMMPSFERLSYLEQIVMERAEETKISLSDLDILSKPAFPIRINYFYIRGLDSQETGPYLIPILNIDYGGVKMSGHDVMFNFTRINDVNTFGARINF